MNRACLLLLGLTLAAVELAPSRASAQSNAALAESLYQEGKRLVGEKNYAEACPKFEESYKLDPATGTLLNLAACYESAGKYSTAWAYYNDALSASKREGQDVRAQYANDHLKALEEKLTRLRVDLAEGANVPGLEVKLDGRPLNPAAFGVPSPVDPGTHVIEATAPGKKPARVEVAANAPKGVVKALVPVLEDDGAAGSPAGSPPAPAQDTGSASPAAAPANTPANAPSPAPETDKGGGGGISIPGLILTGVGVAAVGAGVAFNLGARSEAKQADKHCIQPPDYKTCIDNADQIAYHDSIDAAKRKATFSYIAFGVGGAALATGVTLLFIGGGGSESKASADGFGFEVSDQAFSLSATRSW